MTSIMLTTGGSVNGTVTRPVFPVAGIANRRTAPIPTPALHAKVKALGYQMLRPAATYDFKDESKGEINPSNLAPAPHRTVMERMVMVKPSFYGTDNRCMVDSLTRLGGAGGESQWLVMV